MRWLKKLTKKIHYGICLATTGGTRVLFDQLRRRIYSRATHFGLEVYPHTDTVPVDAEPPIYLQKATQEDMEEALRLAKSEDRESIYELTQRKWFYEAGFRDCYIARTVANGELCYMQWLITPRYTQVASHGLIAKFLRLKEGDCLLENAFTFQKYRGRNIMPAVMAQLCEIARQDGFKRVITYVRQDNIAALKGCQKVGFKKFEEMHEINVMFFAKTKYTICPPNDVY